MANERGVRSRKGNAAAERSFASESASSGRSSVRARATLLVGELRGLSAFAKRVEPESSVALLQDFYSSLADIAVGYSAAVDRVVGDVFVVVFQTTGSRQDDSARAVHASIDLQRAYLGLRNRWQADDSVGDIPVILALGVATGPLILAQIDGVPGVHSIPFGEPLNRAQELCSRAGGADTLIDEMTYATAHRCLEDAVTFTSCEVAGGGRDRDVVSGYRVQEQRAGLRVVSRRSETDPVCGSSVRCRAGTPTHTYGESTFFFCSPACAQRFAADPESWLPGLPRGKA